MIRSVAHPEQEYVGASENLKQSVANHNTGKSTRAIGATLVLRLSR
jgi:predicted GIY-YIG superfamily endonuclease